MAEGGRMRQWGDYQPYPQVRIVAPRRNDPAGYRQRLGYCLGGLVLLISIGLSVAVNGGPSARTTCGSACATPAGPAPADGRPAGPRPAAAKPRP